jgi:hypothetical protein
LILFAFKDGNAGGLEGLAKVERPTLVDDFSVWDGKGDGVVARVKRGGNVREERRAVRVADEGEEEVGAVWA